MQIDPIALCLVRELVEADEAKVAMEEAGDGHSRTATTEALREYWGRCDYYDTTSEALLSHLLIMPCPQIDTSAYEALWKESLMLTEDERENGKLWDAVEDIAQRAIALYGFEGQS